MDLVSGSPRIVNSPGCDPFDGEVRWQPIKSLWIGSMSAAALVLGPLFFSWHALLVFLALSAITLCAGHSVGMHRRLIHNSFACPLWLEYVLVYLGVLVGMAGPFGMIRQHDIRDWAQRQPRCHDYLCHRRSFWRDGFWQLHCELRLAQPPKFELEPRLAHDRLYLWMERTWMLHQLPLGLVLFALGGWGWVVWGIAVRVSVCVTGHWLIGTLRSSHRPTILARRRRRRARLRRAGRRAPQHGRELAQQPPTRFRDPRASGSCRISLTPAGGSSKPCRCLASHGISRHRKPCRSEKPCAG